MGLSIILSAGTIESRTSLFLALIRDCFRRATHLIPTFEIHIEYYQPSCLRFYIWDASLPSPSCLTPTGDVLNFRKSLQFMYLYCSSRGEVDVKAHEKVYPIVSLIYKKHQFKGSGFRI